MTITAPVTEDTAAESLARLTATLTDVRAALVAAESSWSTWLDGVPPRHAGSARNMVHYWALRQHDLRDLQAGLSRFGLSSLGRSEPHVLATVRVVLGVAAALSSGSPPPEPMSTDEQEPLLLGRAVDLLGPAPDRRGPRIMVTLPSEAADDPALVSRLVARGMDLARINCAHDDSAAWTRMAGHVRRASAAAGRECRIAMDLAGPKLRTGPLEPGPRVIKLKPAKDDLGRVTAPVAVQVVPAGTADAGAGQLPVPAGWLGRRRDGEVVTVRDTRGSTRHLRLTEQDGGWLGAVDRTTYLGTGTVLVPPDSADTCEIGPLPTREQKLTLYTGDVLDVTRDCTPAPVRSDRLRIGCTLPAVFDHARPGQQVHVDDGRISGQIEDAGPDLLRVRITRAAPGGSTLRAGKGINVPDTRLDVPALTAKDVADLETAVALADVVDLSFVREPADVARLLHELDRLGDDRLGVVLKIETTQAFRNLPQLLLTLMARPRIGVMIARGDLAVECGYARLAELQEEIMWLCESAHVPVIWATQVLEQLAKDGQPSRAEISDAAMGERAECVMLNKGPYIDEAVTVLADVLRRMAQHHDKKNALLPSLHSWRPDQWSDS